uniref:Cytokinin synthase 3 n=1 Tax=Solanum tuberosum TaxID=4113 RepID=M1DDQ7_SOLTU
MGAIGTGKSRLSVDLATHFRGEIINSDKVQVYKGLEIVTNKITHAEKQGVRHYLLDAYGSIIEVPAYSNVPPATTRDEVKADEVAKESEVDTDEEHFGVCEEVVYEDLVDLDGAMYKTTRQVSLRDVSMVSSNGIKDDVIPGTDAQTESVLIAETSGTDVPTDRVTEM